MEQYEKPSMEVLDLQNDAILTSGGSCAVNLNCPSDTAGGGSCNPYFEDCDNDYGCSVEAPEIIIP